MQELLLLAAAGALGTISRYALGGFTHKLLGQNFPYGTLAVNVAGCFLIGFLMHLGLSTTLLSRTARMALTIGFLGAFTTFSSFSYETIRLIEQGLWQGALLNISANLILGLLATFGGLSLGRAIFGGAL